MCNIDTVQKINCVLALCNISFLSMFVPSLVHSYSSLINSSVFTTLISLLCYTSWSHVHTNMHEISNNKTTSLLIIKKNNKKRQISAVLVDLMLTSLQLLPTATVDILVKMFLISPLELKLGCWVQLTILGMETLATLCFYCVSFFFLQSEYPENHKCWYYEGRHVNKLMYNINEVSTLEGTNPSRGELMVRLYHMFSKTNMSHVFFF